jgi:hypothetical protein
MELHPCERCDAADFPWTEHEAGGRRGALTSAYVGECPSCGTPRRFEFRVPDDPVPPPAFGGPEPSQIIDPGEFLEMGDRAAAYADSATRVTSTRDAGGSDAGASDAAYDAALDAVAAVEEVLKFLPPGADAVPERAFTSEIGRAVRAADPSRFDRGRLEELLSARLRALHRLAGDGTGTSGTR